MHTSMLHASLLCALLLQSPESASQVAAARAPQVDVQALLDQLLDDAWMARPDEPRWTLLGASSAGQRHTGGQGADEDRGHGVRVLEREGRREAVLVDAHGPGALVRLWSANPRGILRIEVDGARVVEASFADFLAGAGLAPEPLALATAMGRTSLAPIPCARSLLVTVDECDGLRWQADWRSYEPDARVVPFQPADAVLWRRAASSLARRPGGAAWTHTYSLSEHSERGGDLLALSPAVAQGARAVREIDLAVDADDLERALSGMVLRLSFDGEETVRVPFCEFFGTSARVDELRTRHLEVAKPARFVARWPMPYRRSFGLAIDSVHDPRVHVSGAVRTEPWDVARPSWRFHAQWNSSGPLATRPRTEVQLLSVKGTGRYLGAAIHVANPVGEWWGDGDERLDVDGRLAWLGTGTEDHLGQDWRATEPCSAPWGAQARSHGPANRGHALVSRHRLLDAIPFSTAMSARQENRHRADTTIERSSTAWFYLAADGQDGDAREGRTAAELVASLPVLRLWERPGLVEAEGLRVGGTSPGLMHGAQELLDAPAGRWSRGAQLWVRSTKPGDWIELELPVARPGRRRLVAAMTRSHDYGIVSIQVDGGAPVVVDTASGGDVEPPRDVDLGVHELGARAKLRFEVVGAGARSTGARHYFGIDGVLVE
jgi:hypothetical protein